MKTKPTVRSINLYSKHSNDTTLILDDIFDSTIYN